MSSKNCTILSVLVILFSLSFTFAKAQESTTTETTSTRVYRGAGYDYLDTSLVPARRMDQQRDFLKNEYDFPAKPRNQWEIGISGGFVNVSGDVRTKMPWRAKNPGQTLGFGVHVRKAWGYVISTRLQYLHGKASGFNWQSATGYSDHGGQNPWSALGYGYNPVFYNYQTNIDELSLQLVASLNNIKFHKARNKASLYVLAGLGGTLYDTWVDALKSNKRYDFSNIINHDYNADQPDNWTNTYKSRNAKNDDLLALFDGEYETRAERHDNRPWFGKEKTYRTVLTAGMGIQFKLGKKVSLSIEDKWSYTNDDLVDGQRWQEWPAPGNGGSALTRDFDTYNYASIGLNLSLGGKSVEPLWWMNPLDYGYNELKRENNNGSPCDIDSDGDGVSDCFDACPGTEPGVAVDTHGCCLDTDGDGVCDYKDKQLITPTECQPSDADGIGNCPDPKCCDPKPVKGCSDIKGGTISSFVNKVKLSSEAKAALSILANDMRANPTCRVVITGNGNENKLEEQRSWDRVNNIINYMRDNQGIDGERFIFRFGASGEPGTVSYRPAAEGESGEATVAPKHPELTGK